MARASNIYLVVWNDYDGVCPRAAFTVKHEMVSWLRRQSNTSLRGCSVMRMPDNSDGEGATFSIEELLGAG
jgi:hypothetical protein